MPRQKNREFCGSDNPAVWQNVNIMARKPYAPILKFLDLTKEKKKEVFSAFYKLYLSPPSEKIKINSKHYILGRIKLIYVLQFITNTVCILIIIEKMFWPTNF